MEERYILLVDDEKNIANSLIRELREWTGRNGYACITAESGVEGLSILEQMGDQVKIVVSDLRMPGMTGSEFLEEAKRRYPDLVCLLLTGHIDVGEIARAVSAGIFSFLLKPWDRAYLIAEIDKAATFGELSAERKSNFERLREELRWAGEMQKALLKPTLSSTEGVEFRLSYRPLPDLGCGGDYYDVVSMGKNRYLMLLGEVEGHGVRAAFMTGILKAVIYPEYLRSFQGAQVSPGEFLGWLNERMNFETRNTSSTPISFFAGLLDLDESVFRYANAGQSKPFMVSGGAVRELPARGPAIGIDRAVHYVDQTVNTVEDSIVFMFSDGLVRLRGPDGGASAPNLPVLLAKTPYTTDYHKKILEGVLSASNAGRFMDDVTILSARVGKHAAG